jgi:hypothetical protein
VRGGDEVFGDVVFGVEVDLIGGVSDCEFGTVFGGIVVGCEEVVALLFVVEEVVDDAFFLYGRVEAVGVEFEVGGEGFKVGVVTESHHGCVVQVLVNFYQLVDLV